MLEHARAQGLEGLISKLRDAPYRSGRNDNWIKSKCGQNQEFVIVGYKDASHLKGAIGALVLGYNEGGKLHYAGRSGTGYTMETARDLWKKLQPLRRDTIRRSERSRRKSAAARASGSSRSSSPRSRSGLHGAKACAPRRVQGLARGQAREGNRAGDADADESKAKKAAKSKAAAKRRRQTPGR